MRLQRKIIWVSFAISIISLALFILFSTFWKSSDSNAIISSIFIAIFGSSLMVFVPALITFYKIKADAKQKIAAEISAVENLVNDVHFQTSFLKDVDGKYNLDFSFEKTKYELSKNISMYIAQKDIYEITTKRVEKLYDTFLAINHYDYSFFDAYLEDYVGVFGNETIIHMLADKYYEILSEFMMSSAQFPFEYGVRQYEFYNASTGTFFNLWFKKFLEKLEPIYKKLVYLRTMLLIMNLRFYKSSYQETVNSNEIEKKLQLKKFIEEFYEDNKIKKSHFIKKLMKQLN